MDESARAQAVNDAVAAEQSHWRGIVSSLREEISAKDLRINALEIEVYLQAAEIKRLEAFAGKELI